MDTVDLWIGGLAEERLQGSLLGPTFACLFGITFSNLRAGDRFFYQNPGQFEEQQLKSIETDSLSRVICDNSDNINTIQPDAFLAGTSRVPCNQIPRLDLSLWKEEICYLSVEVRNAFERFPVRSYSRINDRIYFQFFFDNIRLGETRGCVPFLCPGLAGTSEVLVFTANQNIFIQPNTLLPRNLMNDPFYRATFEARLVDANTGLFSTLAACEGPSPAGLTITVNSPVNMEENMMQQNNRITVESPSTNVRVPREILDILLKPVSPATATSTAANPGSNEAEAEAQLMSDLEEALNALKE